MTRPCVAALLVISIFCVAWMNPTRDRITEANQLYDQGKFDEAITKYGEALVDNPDSPLLNFNMGDANYKAGKYEEAMASFSRVPPDEANPGRTVKAVYNAGNAQYRLGVAAEAGKPQDALTAYANALVAYRRAIGADPTNRDAKFNYEFVSKKIEDLKKKLEEQQKQQDQQQQQQDQKQDQQKDQQQQQQNQQQQDQQQDTQQGDQQQKQQEQAQQDKPQDQNDSKKEQAQADAQEKNDADKGSDAQAAQKADQQQQQMSPQEAAALIDTAKNDEVQPQDFARQVQGGTVVEPAEDW